MYVLAGTTGGATGFNQLSYPDCVDLRKNSTSSSRSSSTSDRDDPEYR